MLLKDFLNLVLVLKEISLRYGRDRIMALFEIEVKILFFIVNQFLDIKYRNFGKKTNYGFIKNEVIHAP